MQWNPRRDYEAGGLDLGPNDVRDTYGARQDDIAQQARHTTDIEREERDAMAAMGGLRGAISRWWSALRRR